MDEREVDSADHVVSVREDAPLRRKVFSSNRDASERLIYRFSAVIKVGLGELVYPGFHTQRAALDWAENRLCEIYAAQELRATGALDAAEMCRGLLTG